ncbi:MAG: DUF2379 family protein, partial [Cystobacter sp.]
DYLATFESIFRTGQVQKDFHPWGQLRALALRVEQGFPLVVGDALGVFLRSVAPTVAMSESEAEEILEIDGGAESLVTTMGKLVKEGRQRVSQALQQAIRLQESGDIERARDHLRAAFAVEVIPQYRQMLEENLSGLDEPSAPSE